MWLIKNFVPFRGIFSHVSGMYERILIELLYIVIIYYQVHIQCSTFEFKGQGHRHFPKVHFSDGCGILMNGGSFKFVIVVKH